MIQAYAIIFSFKITIWVSFSLWISSEKCVAGVEDGEGDALYNCQPPHLHSHKSMHSNQQNRRYSFTIQCLHICIHTGVQSIYLANLFGGGLLDVWALHCCVDKWFYVYESCVYASGKPYCRMDMNVDSISCSMIYKMGLRDGMKVGKRMSNGRQRGFSDLKRDTCF